MSIENEKKMIEVINVLATALMFYANETHWTSHESPTGGGLRVEGNDCEDSPLWSFSGRRARAALKEATRIKES